jgi:exosortase D (VPLPA-CTERM-specific)
MAVQPSSFSGKDLSQLSTAPGVRPSLSRGLMVLAIACTSLFLAGFIYSDTLVFLLDNWLNDENYGHGLFIPLISLFLIWTERHRLGSEVGQGSWWGVGVIGLAGLLYVVGETATLHVLLHISFWMILVGLALCLIGLHGVRAIAFPLLYLLNAIPLPGLLQQTLSSQLQLMSSSLGVGCLQFVGVMAYQEGNVIDLGPIQLQVVEACSGLRYLFPLVSLSLLCAYLYREALWKRILVFLSSIPIAILLNGFRIGTIGLLVEYYGGAAAEGFGHFFEGWIFFVASLSLVFGEMWLLSRISSTALKKPWAELFSIRGSSPTDVSSATAELRLRAYRSVPMVWCSLGLIGIIAVTSATAVKRGEIIPSRESLLDFKKSMGSWQGSALAMEKEYLDVLKLDDYVLANYASPDQKSMNLYIGYYVSQQKGRTPHSPAACMPGGGWVINSLQPLQVGLQSSAPFAVNRVLIQKGDEKQLVLYWFKQRDRLLADEFLVKFFLFWDALTRRRSDGALIRLVTPITTQDSEEAAERRLLDFAGLVSAELPRYVPD